MSVRDPLADPRPLIRAVYAFVAYRLGPGPEAEDVTSDVFERALRYRDAYDPRRGQPLSWLLGIARRCLADRAAQQRAELDSTVVEIAGGEVEADAVRRVTVAAAVNRLDERERELLALRFGADLTARQIGEVVGMKTNAVEVALHRTLGRLRATLEDPRSTPRPGRELQPD